jgi:hypothetical protein
VFDCLHFRRHPIYHPDSCPSTSPRPGDYPHLCFTPTGTRTPCQQSTTCGV